MKTFLDKSTGLEYTSRDMHDWLRIMQVGRKMSVVRIR